MTVHIRAVPMSLPSPSKHATASSTIEAALRNSKRGAVRLSTLTVSRKSRRVRVHRVFFACE